MIYRIFLLPTLTAVLLTGCSSAPPKGSEAPVETRLPDPPQHVGSASVDKNRMAETRPASKSESIARPAPAVRPRIAYRVETQLKDNANAAVASLLRKAESAGSPYAAAAILERALRIEPNNPVVWNRLANVRLEQGRFEQAEALAMKSNTLAAARPSLWPKNWDIIARARDRLGNIVGAAEAETKRRSGVR